MISLLFDRGLYALREHARVGHLRIDARDNHVGICGNALPLSFAFSFRATVGDDHFVGVCTSIGGAAVADHRVSMVFNVPSMGEA